jgi:uncharacterized SAM-binding protein YcdF (DUF218 family)
MKDVIYEAYKFLPLLLYPAGLTALLALLGLLALIFGRRKKAVSFVVLAMVIFVGSSLPATSHFLNRSLEGRYLPLEEYPKVSAIVLLGGAEVPPNPPRVHPETNMNADRIMHAARLYHQGVAQYIIPTGGRFRLEKTYQGTAAEVSEALLAELFDVPREAILVEGESLITGDHGAAVRAVLEAKGLPLKVVVVTSARHMPRSVKVFEKSGIEFFPAPTDFGADAEYVWEARSFIPTAEALDGTTRALHEYYGLAAYRVFRWVD